MAKSQKSAVVLKGKKILHIITGSIAAYKVGDLIQDLRNDAAQVTCVMTESSKHFVTPLVLRALSGQRVYSEFFGADSPYDVLHTSLAEEADLILVAPASADFLAHVAAGFANDLATCILLAARKPVVVVPAMNDQMLMHPKTQENIQTLKGWGYKFVDPVEGPLVCGKTAVGHVASNVSILQSLEKSLKK